MAACTPAAHLPAGRPAPRALGALQQRPGRAVNMVTGAARVGVCARRLR